MVRQQKPIADQALPAWATTALCSSDVREPIKRDQALGCYLLSATDTARLLNVSEKTVRRLIAAGNLKHVRIGRIVRIHPSEVERFLAEASHSTAAPVREGKETGRG